MNIKDNMDFYLERIPALSSPEWEYADDPTFHDVMAWHPLTLSDPDVDILGRIGIQNTGTSIHYFVRLDSGRRCYPTFSEIAPLRLAQFESYTKPIVQPTFDELKSEALRVVYELISKRRAGWIKKRNDWLEQIKENKRISETWED